LRFPGQQYDAATGLHYNYYRDYEPGTGRYVESDPIGLLGGPNTYAYVKLSPLRWTDSTGLVLDGPDPALFELGRQKQCAQIKLYESYVEMRESNFIGADKYFHCKGNCEAAKCGPLACDEAELLSEWREIYGVLIKGDDPVDSAEDTRANDHGREGGSKSPATPCQVTCQQFRPPGLPAKY
jgi:RHS repeat-associated protein